MVLEIKRKGHWGKISERRKKSMQRVAQKEGVIKPSENASMTDSGPADSTVRDREWALTLGCF